MPGRVGLILPAVKNRKLIKLKSLKEMQEEKIMNGVENAIEDPMNKTATIIYPSILKLKVVRLSPKANSNI